MKKLFTLILLLLIIITSCSKAEILVMEKNKQASDKGLARAVTVYSAYTGQILFQKTIRNSYFSGTASSGTDIDILDLKNGMKTSIIGDNVIIIIEEME